MKLIKIYSLLLVITFLILSCGGETKKIKKETSPAISVKVSSINSENDKAYFTASGKIKATNEVTLSTRSSGYVDNIYANIGDKVKKGKLLISINNNDLKAKRAQVNARITEATAAYTIAEKDFNRYKNLFDKNSVSQKEMDDMYANFKMAEARLDAVSEMKNEINAQFRYVDIKAPFNGVVTSKHIELGDLANPGMALISIEEPGKFDVMLTVSEGEISQIKIGTKVPVLVKSIGEIVYGEVTEASTSAKNNRGQYLVKITLDKTDIPILSGMYANVKFPSNKKSNSEKILIPLDVIITKGQLSGVYTISQNKTALLRWLRLGKIYGDNIEVLSGLNADEQYIVSAEGKLYNGVKVITQ